jgi:hypothetical protein
MWHAWERSAYWGLLGKLEETYSAEHVGVRGKLMLKCTLEEGDVKGVDWIHLVHDSDKTVMNFWSK